MSAALAAAVVAALAVPGAAQRQFEELGKRGLPWDRDATRATALGDVDGDGDLDLVVGNQSQQNRLYFNNGTGTFTDVTAARLPVADDTTLSVALGDVDGDADLDLIVGNYRQQNRLYLNDGSGSFSDATATHMPIDNDQTMALVVGDVDGDGDLDLIVGNYRQQNRLYLNSGNGAFSDATATRMPIANDQTTSLAIGDVDGDADLDLVVGNWPTQRTALYLNNGNGTFFDATATHMPFDGDQTRALALADVDGDADLDLVVGNNSQQNRLYLNDGTGTFSDATATRMPVESDLTRALAIGDVDGDTDLDLVVGNSGQQNRLLLNDGNGTFSDATAARIPVYDDKTSALAIGDVDGDGDADLVVGNGERGQQDRLYLNDGTAMFSDATAPRIPVDDDQTRALAIGDVDGDADLDLVAGNYARQNRLYLNDGNGTFSDVTAARFPVNTKPTTSLVLGDVDGDGDLDLVTGNGGPGRQNYLYLNDGTGTFTDVTTTRMPVDSDWTLSLVLGDVDGDGDPDLIIGNRGQNRLYLNDGTGTFTDATATRIPVDNDQTRALALGDVDADGDLDLVVGNYDYFLGRQNRLYLNDGTGTFSDATLAHMPGVSDRTTSLALGDVDADGDLDLVIGNYRYRQGEKNRLYLNDGTGTFTDATLTRLPAYSDSTSSLVLGDIDGDGDIDLVVGNMGYVYVPQNRLYLNDGTGRFKDETFKRMPVDHDVTVSLALGDVDGDSDLDLVAGNVDQNRLYQNLLRHLDAPYVLHVGRTYQLDVYARYGPPWLMDVALPLLSTHPASIPLPPLGTLGIDPGPMVALPPLAITQPAGVASVVLNVPNVPSLGGLSLWSQALLVQQPVQARLTNATGDVILR